MNPESMPYIWVGVMVFSIILEVVTMEFVSIWFMPSALVAFAISFFSDDVFLQLSVFVVLSAILLFLSQKIFKKFLLKKPFEPTNADSYIGKVAIVTEEINNIQTKGEVKLEGKYWTARSVDENNIIPVGTEVLIERIEGVKVFCSCL